MTGPLPPRRPVSRRTALGVGLTALAATGCLGRLHRSATAAEISLAPAAPLALPIHEHRPHWLFRGAPGWLGAHRVRFGGDPADPAVTIVRTALFRDEREARAAFARLTPAYLHRILRHRMVDAPTVTAYPAALAGDEVQVLAFPALLPADEREDALVGQLTTIRAGRTVLILESISVPPAQLVAAIAALTAAAERLTSE